MRLERIDNVECYYDECEDCGQRLDECVCTPKVRQLRRAIDLIETAAPPARRERGERS